MEREVLAVCAAEEGGVLWRVLLKPFQVREGGGMGRVCVGGRVSVECLPFLCWTRLRRSGEGLQVNGQTKVLTRVC